MANSLRFQSFTLDLQRLCLRGPAGEVDLRPKSFEVLRYLAEHAGRVVPKEEVIKAVWPDVTVTDESLTRCISEVRRAIGDDAQKVVKTISRRGYLFDAPDLAGSQTENLSDTDAGPPSHRRGNRLAAQPPSTNRPSIAVLPFANMSGDPEQEYFSDGITEDIITDLSKISGLFVVARNTTFTYKGRAVNVRQVSEELNVKFILEGSVRKAGSRVRITAQLVKGSDGGHLWADRYDRDLSDIFMIQDEITRTIVDQLKVKLLPEENRAIGATPTESVEAYAYYLRGRQFLHRRSKTFLELARRMFARAAEIDPLYARAYAGIADCDSFLRLHYGAKVSIDGILAMGARALELKSDLAEAHASRGLAFSLLGQYPQAMHEFDEAIAVNPNLFEAHYFCARACFTQGKLEDAANHYQRAADINPDDCQAMLVLVGVLRSLGRTQEMISAAREGVARAERELALHPENPRPAHLGAVALAELGELDRAKDWAARAIAIDPDDVLTQYNGACFYSLVGDHDRAIDLLLAVLPRVDRQTKEWVKYDSDLNPLRDNPRFAKVLELLD
jgi:adenylate cyclase